MRYLTQGAEAAVGFGPHRRKNIIPDLKVQAFLDSLHFPMLLLPYIMPHYVLF